MRTYALWRRLGARGRLGGEGLGPREDVGVGLPEAGAGRMRANGDRHDLERRLDALTRRSSRVPMVGICGSATRQMSVTASGPRGTGGRRGRLGSKQLLLAALEIDTVPPLAPASERFRRDKLLDEYTTIFLNNAL
jgi:hypothetical protein